MYVPNNLVLFLKSNVIWKKIKFEQLILLFILVECSENFHLGDHIPYRVTDVS